MESILKERLWAYIVTHNPELMFSLQEDFSVTRYLEEKVKSVMPLVERLVSEEKPLYAIEELCLNELTEELKPSRFLFIKAIFDEEFPEESNRFKETGTLTYEIVNLIKVCELLFEKIGFSEGNHMLLRDAIKEQVNKYLTK